MTVPMRNIALTPLQRRDMAQRAFAQMMLVLGCQESTRMDVRTTIGYKGTDNMTNTELVQHCNEMDANYHRWFPNR